MGNVSENGKAAKGKGEYARILLCISRLTEPAIRSAIQALQLPSGSRGLDAGCGTGNHALWLAEAVSPTGHVTGMDIAPDHLAFAERIASNSGLAEQVSFEEVDLNKLPFDDDSFD